MKCALVTRYVYILDKYLDTNFKILDMPFLSYDYSVYYILA